MEYSEVKEQIKQKLPVQKEFGDSENLLELGLSSIVIMRLVNQWRKQGVKVAFGTLMEHPTLKEWWKIIQKGTKKKGKESKSRKTGYHNGKRYAEAISFNRCAVCLLGRKRG